MANDIFQRIKFFRHQKGYSQENIANQLSIKQNTFARIEKNIIKLDVEKLIKIAEVLDVDLYLLLTGNIPSNYNLNDIDSYIESLRSIIKMQEEEIKLL